MTYDTYNLDEAAYLALQGYPFTVTRTGPKSALFSFEADQPFNEARAKFWKGEATVQLHGWLATRTALKHACAGQALSAKSIASPSIVPAGCEAEAVVRKGFLYWYHDGNTAKSETFGNKPLHKSRWAQGNLYRTKADALNKRNAIPAV